MTQISHIYAQGPAAEIQPDDAQGVDHSNRARLWHKTGIAIIDPDRLHNWADRELVIQLAQKLYGKRADT